MRRDKLFVSVTHLFAARIYMYNNSVINVSSSTHGGENPDKPRSVQDASIKQNNHRGNKIHGGKGPTAHTQLTRGVKLTRFGEKY